jgi:hypothetical protein
MLEFKSSSQHPAKERQRQWRIDRKPQRALVLVVGMERFGMHFEHLTRVREVRTVLLESSDAGNGGAIDLERWHAIADRLLRTRQYPPNR